MFEQKITRYLFAATLALVFFVFACTDTDTTKTPAVDLSFALFPNQGTQGTTVNLTLLCSNDLFNENTVVDFGEQIQVLATQIENANQIVVRIFIQYDADLGNQEVLVTTSNGTSSISEGFTITAYELVGGIISYIFDKQSLLGPKRVAAAGAFFEPGPDIWQWWFGSPMPPSEGEVLYSCAVGYGEACTVEENIHVRTLSAGERLTINSGTQAVSLERVVLDSDNGVFGYAATQTLDPANYQFDTEHTIEPVGGMDVPRFEASFETPCDFDVTSHNLFENTLDVVQGHDLRVTWDSERQTEGSSSTSRVVIELIHFGFFGNMEWLSLTVPDTGEAAVLASELEQLGSGYLFTRIFREIVTEIRLPANPPIWMVSRIEQKGIGEIFDAGTKVGYLSPRIGTQKEQLNVEVTGINSHFLEGNTTANFGPGIQVQNLVVNSPTSATATIAIDAITPPGTRMVTLETPANADVLSIKDPFTAKAAPPTYSVQEDTNNDVSGVLTPGDCVFGKIDTEGDVDRYDIHADADTVLMISVQAQVLDSLVKSEIALFDQTDTEVARHTRNDSFLAYPVSTSQDFHVTIEHRGNEGGDDYFYYLDVKTIVPTNLPAPADPVNVDKCDVAKDLGPDLVSETFYVGDTTGFGNTEIPGEEFEGCVWNTSFGGEDATYPVTLDPGETVIAWSVQPERDASLYLLSSCGDLTSCLAGHDNTVSGSPEVLTYRNDTNAVATYYLVVDTYYRDTMSSDPGGLFYLHIVIYQVFFMMKSVCPKNLKMTFVAGLLTCLLATCADKEKNHDLTLAKIDPTQGPETGDTLIQISGSGLWPGPIKVLLDGELATDIQVMNDHLVTALAPKGKAGTSADVVVSKNGATASLTNAFRYLSTMELEPNDQSGMNDEAAKAQEIPLNADFYGHIGEELDSDFYRFRAPKQGIVSITVDYTQSYESSRIVYMDFATYVGDEIPCQITGIEIIDPAYTGFAIYENFERSVNPDVGDYLLKIKSNTASEFVPAYDQENPYRLRVDFFPGPDLESDQPVYEGGPTSAIDTWLDAYPIPFDQGNWGVATVQSHTWYEEDFDWYQFTAGKNGWLRITTDIVGFDPYPGDVAIGLSGRVFVAEPEWQEIGSSFIVGDPPNVALLGREYFNIYAGTTYYLRLWSLWGQMREQPYVLKFEHHAGLIEDDEPGDVPSGDTEYDHLDLGVLEDEVPTTSQSYMWHIFDRDWFVFRTPSGSDGVLCMTLDFQPSYQDIGWYQRYGNPGGIDWLLYLFDQTWWETSGHPFTEHLTRATEDDVWQQHIEWPVTADTDYYALVRAMKGYDTNNPYELEVIFSTTAENCSGRQSLSKRVGTTTDLKLRFPHNRTALK